LSKGGSCIVNIPAPQRYAIHKLIIYGERPVAQRVKANKDLGQAASIIKVLLDTGNEETLKSAWKDALSRGPGWEKRAIQGCRAMLKIYPNLDIPGFW
jgi:hypothetical protein